MWGQEDPLEKGMATHSSVLAWDMPWTEDPSGLQSMGSQETNLTFRSLSWKSVAKLCSLFLRFCGQPTYSPWSSVHGISQAWILELVAIPFSRESSQPTDPKLRLLHWQVGSLPLSHTKMVTLSYLEFIFVYGVQEYSNFILVFTVQGTSEVRDRWVPGWKFTASLLSAFPEAT